MICRGGLADRSRVPRRALACSVVVSLMLPALSARALDLEKWERSVGRVICLDEDGDVVRTGSCFVVNDHAALVTNRHVVEDCRQLAVAFSDSEKVRATVVAKDERLDLALLRAEKSLRPPLTIGDGQMKKGDPVYCIGFPGTADISMPAAWEASITNGIVEKLTMDANGREVVQTSAEIRGGNSGGPLLDECGAVQGVNTFKHVSQAEDSRFAVSATELQLFLKQSAIDFDTRHFGCGGPVSGSGVLWVVLALLLGTGAVVGVLLLVRVQRGPGGNGGPTGVQKTVLDFNAGGGGRPIQLVGTSGPLAGRSFVVPPTGAFVGREPQLCTILFPPDCPNVGRQHAEVRQQGDLLYVRDINSKAGVLLDGVRLAPGPWHPVRAGQSLGIGSTANGFRVQ